MNTVAIAICVVLGACMLLASTIAGKNEPWSHRVFQMLAGVSLGFVALHLAGVFP